jgi:flagellar protein FlaI
MASTVGSDRGSSSSIDFEVPGGYDDPSEFELPGDEVSYDQSLVRPADIEKTIPDEQKPHLDASKGDAYWLEKGFSLALVYYNTSDKEYKYFVVTPYLHPREQLLIKYLQQKLVNELEFPEMPLDMSRKDRQREIQRTINSLLLRTSLADKDTIRGTQNYYSVVDEEDHDPTPESTLLQRALRFFSGKRLSSKAEDKGLDELDDSYFENIDDIDQMTDIEAEELEEEARSLAPLSEHQIDKILYYIVREQVGYGKIQPLLDDPNIEDISVDGYNSNAWVYHSEFTSVQTNIAYHERDLDEIINYIAEADGKGISKRQPQVNAILEDGSRAQLTLGDEVSERGSNFTIRVFKEVPFTPIDLIHWHTYNLEQMAHLWLVTENEHHMIFAGKTASGKTTTLNACSLFIPVRKVVSIEDTPELSLPHKHWVQETTREHHGANDIQDYGMEDLLKAALRQRPDYILIGEVRDESAADTLFETAKTGHTTKTTFHAGDTKGAISRFAHDLDISKSEFSEIDLVAVQDQYHKDGERQRRSQEIVEVGEFDEDTKRINKSKIFEWDPATDSQVRTDNDSLILEDIKTRKGWDEDHLQEEINRRKIVLATLITEGIVRYENVSAVIQAYMRDPDAVLAYCANGTLKSHLSGLTNLESLSLDVSENQEQRISRPFSEERFAKAQEILDENSDIIEEAREKDVSSPDEEISGVASTDVDEQHDNSEGALGDLFGDDSIGENSGADSSDDTFGPEQATSESQAETDTTESPFETSADADADTVASNTDANEVGFDDDEGSVFINEGESVEPEDTTPSTESDAPRPEVTQVEEETDEPEDDDSGSGGKWFSTILSKFRWGSSSSDESEGDEDDDVDEDGGDSASEVQQDPDPVESDADTHDSEPEESIEPERRQNQTQPTEETTPRQPRETRDPEQADARDGRTQQSRTAEQEQPPETPSNDIFGTDSDTASEAQANGDRQERNGRSVDEQAAGRSEETRQSPTEQREPSHGQSSDPDARRQEPDRTAQTGERETVSTENDVFSGESEPTRTEQGQPDADPGQQSSSGTASDAVRDEFGASTSPDSETQNQQSSPSQPAGTDRDNSDSTGAVQDEFGSAGGGMNNNGAKQADETAESSPKETPFESGTDVADTSATPGADRADQQPPATESQQDSAPPADNGSTAGAKSPDNGTTPSQSEPTNGSAPGQERHENGNKGGNGHTDGSPQDSSDGRSETPDQQDTEAPEWESSDSDPFAPESDGQDNSPFENGSTKATDKQTQTQPEGPTAVDPPDEGSSDGETLPGGDDGGTEDDDKDVPFGVPNALNDSDDEEDTDDAEDEDSVIDGHEKYSLLDQVPENLQLTPEQRDDIRSVPVVGAKITEIDMDDELCEEIVYIEEWELYRQCLNPCSADSATCEAHSADAAQISRNDDD